LTFHYGFSLPPFSFLPLYRAPICILLYPQARSQKLNKYGDEYDSDDDFYHDGLERKKVRLSLAAPVLSAMAFDFEGDMKVCILLNFGAKFPSLFATLCFGIRTTPCSGFDYLRFHLFLVLSTDISRL